MTARKKASTLASIALALHLATAGWAVTAAAEIEWALFARSCARGTSTLEVPCGSYGVFHFVHVVAPSGCQPIVAGAEDPPLYAPPGHLRWFPAQPRLFGDPVTVSSVAAPTGPDPGGRGAASPLLPTGPTRKAATAIPQAIPAPQPAPRQWIAVIDFAGVHGATTSWLIDEVAGTSVDATLAVLDDPALSRLGSVGDFHVLAKVCQIEEAVEIEGMPAPRAVNMSFGRGLQPGESAGGSSCDAATASCQIASVVGRLRARGTRFVAAAGNHRELLFPGSLSGVLPVGMLELNAFFTHGIVRPAWETPPAAKGLIPGNGLCLRQWAAPSGSSYASALFTGWLSDVLAHRPNLDPLAGDLWAVLWHPTLACYVLSQGPLTYPWCNAKVNALLQGLQGTNETECWAITRGGLESLPDPGPPESQPAMPSFPAWTAATSPAPESDPCVPCTGSFNSGSSELQLNLSRSAPMPEGTYLHAVYLRVGDEFQRLTLSPEQLLAFEAGDLSQVVLPDADAPILAGEQPSLWYEMKADPADDCATSSACFWSSTPILLTGN